MAQDEQRKLQSASRGTASRPDRVARGSSATPTSDRTSSPDRAAAAAADPAQLTTVFNHNFTDGRIVVRAGADIVANEALFSERPARLFRRASRSPKPINVTQQLPAKNADLQVWVTIPASNIQEHHVLQAVRFEPGSSKRLVVNYDESTRKFTYELN
jgi:hypothetical protein